MFFPYHLRDIGLGDAGEAIFFSVGKDGAVFTHLLHPISEGVVASPDIKQAFDVSIGGLAKFDQHARTGTLSVLRIFYPTAEVRLAFSPMDSGDVFAVKGGVSLLDLLVRVEELGRLAIVYAYI